MSDDASEYSGAVHRRDAARMMRFVLIALKGECSIQSTVRSWASIRLPFDTA